MEKRKIVELEDKERISFRKNKDFEQRYNEKKQREMAEKLKEKFGEDVSSSSSDESLDELEIFNNKEELKEFLTVYQRIRNMKEETLKEKKEQLFQAVPELKTNKKVKKFTIADQIAQGDPEKDADLQKTVKGQEMLSKKEFLHAAKNLGESDEDLFVQKEQSENTQKKIRECLKEIEDEETKKFWTVPA